MLYPKLLCHIAAIIAHDNLSGDGKSTMSLSTSQKHCKSVYSSTKKKWSLYFQNLTC